MTMLALYRTLSALLALLACFKDSRGSPIWRCPDFKLLPCKSLPTSCSSYRMLYIRHVYLECPACLICVDPVASKPWAIFKAPPTESTKRRKRGRIERGKQRELRKGGDNRPRKGERHSRKDEDQRLRKDRKARDHKKRDDQRKKKEQERAERRRRRKLRRLQSKEKPNELA